MCEVLEPMGYGRDEMENFIQPRVPNDILRAITVENYVREYLNGESTKRGKKRGRRVKRTEHMDELKKRVKHLEGVVDVMRQVLKDMMDISMEHGELLSHPVREDNP